MLSKEEYKQYLEYAKSLSANGHTERAIIFKLAGEKVSDDDIDKIIKDVRSFHRSLLRQKGLQQLILGFSFVIAGMLVAYWLLDFGYLFRFVAVGLPMIGVTIAAKGLLNILGL